MKDLVKIPAYILAGGKSTRMGTEKGLVELQGKAFISHIIDVLSPVTKEINIISNNRAYEQFGYPLIPDLIKEKGPMAGIYTGLLHSKEEFNLFLSCDIPLINEKLLLHLITKAQEKNQTTVIQHKELIEPLCAVYKRSELPLINELIEKNELSVRRTLQVLNTQYLQIEKEDFYHERMFSNINSKEELEQLEKELKWKK